MITVTAKVKFSLEIHKGPSVAARSISVVAGEQFKLSEEEFAGASDELAVAKSKGRISYTAPSGSALIPDESLSLEDLDHGVQTTLNRVGPVMQGLLILLDRLEKNYVLKEDFKLVINQKEDLVNNQKSLKEVVQALTVCSNKLDDLAVRVAQLEQ